MADFDWSPYAASGATRSDSFSGMDSRFRSALESLFSGAPADVRDQLQVYSGFRSPERQRELYAQALAKYGSPAAARQWVAPPGNSQHNKGFAADLKYLDPAAKSWVRENASQYGLSFPLSNEPWHVELAGARTHSIPAVTPVDRSLLPDIGSVPTPTPRSILDAPTEAPATIANQSTAPKGLLNSYDEQPSARPSAFDSVLNGTSPSLTDNYQVSPSYSAADLSKNGQHQPGPTLSYGQFAANPSFTPADPAAAPAFDASRFAGPSPLSPAAIADRNAYGAAQLATQNALAPTVAAANLAEDVAAGRPPGYTPPPAATPTYVDPVVSAGPTNRAPQAPRAPQAIDYTTTAASPVGFDAATQSAASQAARNTSLLDKAQSTHGRNAALGGLLGLGLGGPLGAILGLAVANNLSNKSQAQQAAGYYPDAPSFTGRLSQVLGIDRGSGVTYDSLPSSGKDIVDKSPQARAAVDSGRAGLW